MEKIKYYKENEAEEIEVKLCDDPETAELLKGAGWSTEAPTLSVVPTEPMPTLEKSFEEMTEPSYDALDESPEGDEDEPEGDAIATMG